MIVYFSATGNSKYVAERIADKLHTEAVSLTNCPSEISLSEDDVFGFISPTYHWGLPSIVNAFLETVSFVGKPKYSFFVATYGTTSGQTGRIAEALLRNKSLTLDAKFSIKMPDTWTPTFDLSNSEKVAEINRNAEPQIDEMIQHILDGATGDYMKAKIPMVAVKMYYPTYEKQRQTKHLNVLTIGIIKKVIKICSKNIIKAANVVREPSRVNFTI